MVPTRYDSLLLLYRNVGPFRYWRLVQLPNFLIAAPTLFACLAASMKYARYSWKRFLTLGAFPMRAKPFIFQDALLPHFILLALFVIYALIFVHVQIMARLFSFQPAVYWSLAHFYIDGSLGTKRLITGTCLCYALVGTVLFSNFYPPA